MRIQNGVRMPAVRKRGVMLAATAVVIAAMGVPAEAQQPAPKPFAAIALGDSYISGEGGRWYGNANTFDSRENFMGDRAGTDRALTPGNPEVCEQPTFGLFGGSPASCYRPKNVYRDEYRTPWNPNSLNHGLNEDTGKGTGCHRSDVSEIIGLAKLQNKLPDGSSRPSTDPNYLHPLNLACSGAETKHIIGGPVGDNKEANDRVDADNQVIGFKSENLQIADLAEAAKRYQVKVVVLSIGGNDMGFGPVAENCGKEYALWSDVMANCIDGGGAPRSGKNALAPMLNDKLVTTKAAVKKTVNEIKKTMEAAGQTNYRFVLQTYPQFLAPEPPNPHAPGAPQGENRYPYNPYNKGFRERLTLGGCPFGSHDSYRIREYVSKLSTALKDARNEVNANTGGVDVDFLDVQDAFHGHEICNKNSKLAVRNEQPPSSLPMKDRGAEFEWLRYVDNGFPVSRLQGDKDESVHPNAFGQVALGTCLHKTINRGAGSYTCQPTFTNQELTKTLGPDQVRVYDWTPANPGF
ncbi:hypothetical protein [Streptomyces sp. NPDC087297]|uniref:hypothetical protein n=1 Tax=Streptomyces sp. NPDC087297 TaxID=3365778 RepID=UPI0037FC79B3